MARAEADLHPDTGGIDGDDEGAGAVPRRQGTRDATGISKALTGRITLSPEPAIVAAESLLEFAAKTLRTDAGNRDSQIRTALEAFQFPAITFAPSALKAVEPAQRTDGKFTATLEGVMRIKGVEKPVSFTVTGSLDGGTLTGTAKGELKMTDFGITPLKTMDILWVEELVRLEVTFAAIAAG